jgi:phage tail-like protein
MPGATTPGDAIAPALFTLTIDGVEIASFSELVGITSEAEADGFAEKVLKKLPGKRTPPTVTLRRGLNTDLQLSAWHESVVAGQLATARKNAVLVMYDTTGEPVARYHLQSAWPAKLEIGGVKAGATEVLVETVTLTCEDIQRVAP